MADKVPTAKEELLKKLQAEQAAEKHYMQCIRERVKAEVQLQVLTEQQTRENRDLIAEALAKTNFL
jgi:hypothetical protein